MTIEGLFILAFVIGVPLLFLNAKRVAEWDRPKLWPCPACRHPVSQNAASLPTVRQPSSGNVVHRSRSAISIFVSSWL